MNKKLLSFGLNQNNLTLVLVVIGLFFTSMLNAQFVHPGITVKKSDLDRAKYMVEAQIDPYYTSYQNMAADPKSSYNYVVQGNASFTELGRDSGVNEGAWNSDIRAAYYNAIRWYITGDSRHAEKAIEIFKAWSNLSSVTSGGTDSLSGGIGYIMIEAAEIIKSTYGGWLPADMQAFKDMLVYPGYSSTSAVTGANKTFYWMSYQGDPGRHGNQGLSGWRTVMAMGIFLDNEKMYDRALRYITGDLSLHLNDIPYPTGPSTHTTIKTASSTEFADEYNIVKGTSIANYGYNEVMTNYIWESGQCQESSRDQDHTAFGIGLLTSMSEMAWNQGVNLYANANNRLLLGLEYNMRYNVSYIQSYPDQVAPWEPTVVSGEFIQRFDRTERWYSKTISTDGRGNYTSTRPVFEMPLAHYLGRGFKTEEEVKWINRARDKAIEVSGYEGAGWTNDAIGWGGLTARRPILCYGDPISGFESNGLPKYAMNVIPNTIEAENFDFDPIKKGEGRVYHDLTSTNTGGAYRTFDGVDVEALSTGGYNLTSIASGEWLTYTVSVPETAVYTMTIRYAASQAGGTIKVSAGGSDVTSDVSVPFGGTNSTGDSDWKEFVISNNIILNKGVQNITISFAGVSGSFKLDNFKFIKSGIVKQDQSIKFFTIPFKVVGAADFDPKAIASTALTVSYSSSNTAVATIVSGKVHIVGEGSSTITAMQIGDAYYNAAPNAVQQINVVPSGSLSLSLPTIADTYVNGGAATTNYATATSLVTKANSTSSRYAYYKFDLSSVPGPIISAKLRLYQRTTNKETRNVYDVADDSWTETGLIWNNKPAYTNERASITTNSAWNEWDVSSYVAQEYANDKLITMVINDNKSVSVYGIDFYAKEFLTNMPELVIEYSTAPALSAATQNRPIEMYPNPVIKDLHISLVSGNFDINSTKIILYNMNGQKVLETSSENKSEVILNLSNLQKGNYILKISDNSKSSTKKIIKL